MSAKPSSKAPAPTPKMQKPKKAVKKDSSDDDNPFDSPAPVMSKGIQLLPKPAKGKLHRVICPMCETPGFTSKKAAGRDVRCAQLDCLVPIFTAPPLEVEDEPARAETPTKESTPMPLALKLVLVAVLGGGGLWALATLVLFPDAPKQDDKIVLPDDPGDGPKNTGKNTDKGDGTDNTNTDTDNKPPVVPQGPTIVEQRTKALKRMVTLALKTQAEGNDNKPLCRRLTAEAYAVLGNTDEVKTQLKQMGALPDGQRLKYFEILPLIETAWNSVAAGDTAATGVVISQIQELLPTVPSNRSMALDIVIEFSVLLAAVDRASEAATLVTERQNTGQLGQFMESFARCQFTRTFNLDQAASLRPVGGWSAPQWVAVTVGLTGRGHNDKALAWARSATTSQVVNESIAAWAEATILMHKNASVLPAINKEVNALPEPVKSWTKARIGLTLASVGLVDDAKAVIAQAAISLDPAQAPPKFQTPSETELHTYKVPNVDVTRVRTLGAAELAHAHLLLGSKQVAWNAISVALAQTRNMAPSNIVISQLFGDMNRQGGEDGLSKKFMKSLNLLTLTEGRKAFLNYRANCTSLKTLADVRFALQKEVLFAAITWGFVPETWKEIKGRATDRGTKHENWFDTGLPSTLLAEFQGLGDQNSMQDIKTTVPQKNLEDNNVKRATFNVVAWKHLADGKPKDAIFVLNKFKADNEKDVHWLREIIMRQATKLAAESGFETAVQYTVGISNNEKRQRGIVMQLIASQASLQEDSQVLFDKAMSEQTYPPDAVSILRGFIEGTRDKK